MSSSQGNGASPANTPGTPAKGTPAKPSNGDGEVSSASSEDNDVADTTPVYKTLAEAEAGRREGLALYNAGQYDKCIGIQCGVVRYYTDTYGDLHQQCALPLLDYGLTLLAVLQTRDAATAMMGGLATTGGNNKEGDSSNNATGAAATEARVTGDDDEDMELCFLSLDAARICFEKQEKARPSDPEVQSRLAEVHDALAQLQLEGDNEDEAIKEFSFVLTILNGVEPKDEKRIAAVMFSLGRALQDKGEIVEAKKVLTEAIALAKGAPGRFTADETAEMAAYLEDVEGLEKEGGIEKVREEIRACFPDEDAQVADPQEFAAPANAFLVPLPSEFRSRSGGSTSIPAALMVTIPGREDSGKSNSISFFPKQGSQSLGVQSGSTSNRVTVAAVRKKPRSTDNSLSLQDHNSNSLAAPVHTNGHTNGQAGGSNGSNNTPTMTPAEKKRRTGDA